MDKLSCWIYFSISRVLNWSEDNGKSASFFDNQVDYVLIGDNHGKQNDESKTDSVNYIFNIVVNNFSAENFLQDDE